MAAEHADWTAMFARIISATLIGVWILIICTQVSAQLSSSGTSETASAKAQEGGNSPRGYLTTPAELRTVSELAKRGQEPYRSAVVSALRYADRPWQWNPLPASVKCASYSRTAKDPQETSGGQYEAADEAPKVTGALHKSAVEPAYLSHGSVLVYAKALAYHLTGKTVYADQTMEAIAGLLGAENFGAPGDSSPTDKQCQLNLSWYIPGFIRAADLLESYPAWRQSGIKSRFQSWLASVVYPTISFTAEISVSNWGAAATNAEAYIADYLWDRSDLRLVSYNSSAAKTPTSARSAADAYEHANTLALDRMNGVRAEGPGGSRSACDVDAESKSMIRPDGGIPDELRRGSSGCRGKKILEDDKSNMYSQTHLQNLIAQAELLLRRGDRRIYDNIATTPQQFTYKDPSGTARTVILPAGRGSLRNAIMFVIASPSRQRIRALRSALEVANHYYNDPVMLEAVIKTRPNSGGRAMSFETLTHAFSPETSPPVTAPPR